MRRLGDGSSRRRRDWRKHGLGTPWAGDGWACSDGARIDMRRQLGLMPGSPEMSTGLDGFGDD